MRTGRGFLSSTLLAFVGAAACGSNNQTLDSGAATWRIDCVAVLGAPPPSARTPLEGIPFSGLPRDKLLADLTPDELDHLCEFDACMGTNGFLRDCYTGGTSTPGGFQQETVDLVSGFLLTCYQQTDLIDNDTHQYGYPTLEDARSIYHQYYGTCHVGSWEDCVREKTSDPFGTNTWAPDCATTQQECPVN